MNINHLSISWSASRGRDTYGYNICRLDDRATGKRYRTCGGGYDMIGTVFGEWLEEVYQDRLQAIADRAKGFWDRNTRSHGDLSNPNALYGMTAIYRSGLLEKVSLYGACGINSMLSIAEAIGLDLQWEGNKRGHTIGYFVEDTTK